MLGHMIAHQSFSNSILAYFLFSLQFNYFGLFRLPLCLLKTNQDGKWIKRLAFLFRCREWSPRWLAGGLNWTWYHLKGYCHWSNWAWCRLTHWAWYQLGLTFVEGGRVFVCPVLKVYAYVILRSYQLCTTPVPSNNNYAGQLSRRPEDR